MPKIQPILFAEINPSMPVQEICGVISAIAVYHPGKELQLLEGLQEAITKRIEEVQADADRLRTD